MTSERKPSSRMLVMLYHLSQGRPWYAHLRGRSEHGGGEKTLRALKDRGYIDNVSAANLTQLGHRMVNKYCGTFRGFAPPQLKVEACATEYDPAVPAVAPASLQPSDVLHVVGVDARLAEEQRVRQLLEHMREDGEFDRYFEIPGEDARLMYTWLKGSIDELQSCLTILRQVARETYGREMEPREFAETAGYDH